MPEWPISWQCNRLQLPLGDSKPEESDPGDYDEIVITEYTETIDAFSSCVIHAKMRTAHTGEGINVMTQALHAEDGSLPQGLTVQNAYMSIYASGSKNITVVVRNSMAYPQTLKKKTPVTRAVKVTQIPELPMQLRVDEGIRGGPWSSNDPS